MKMCSNCGSQLKDEFKVCPNCGYPVNNQNNMNNQYQNSNYDTQSNLQNNNQGYQPVNMNMYNQFQNPYGNMPQVNKPKSNIGATLLNCIVLFFDLGFIGILTNDIKEYASEDMIKTFESAGPIGAAISIIFVPLILNIIVFILGYKGYKQTKDGLSKFNLASSIISFILMIATAINFYNYFS